MNLGLRYLWKDAILVPHRTNVLLRGSNWKMDERDMACSELLCERVKDEDDFIYFLRFCVDRLNKDEPVQAIWSAYRASKNKK